MSEERVSYEEALKMAQEHSIQALEAVLIDREAKIAHLQQENERLKEDWEADRAIWRERVEELQEDIRERDELLDRMAE